MRALGLAAVTVLLVSGRANAELVAGQATTVSHPMLQVSGTGTAQVAPDTVRVTASVITEGAIVDTARERNAQVVQRAMKAVEALKLRNVATKTVDYTMQRVTRDVHTNAKADLLSLDVPWKVTASQPEGLMYTLDLPVVLGYEAKNSVTVRVQGVPADELSASAGKIVDALMASGCNQITSVAYSLEQDQTAARREALVKAVKDAQMTAEVVAAAAGRKITGIRSISPSYSPRLLRPEDAVLWRRGRACRGRDGLGPTDRDLADERHAGTHRTSAGELRTRLQRR